MKAQALLGRTRLMSGAALLIGTISMGTGGPVAQAPAAQSTSSSERTVWYFYRVRWGFQDEFLDLFRKNHYPILKAQLGTRLSSIRTYVPTYHGDGRSDWTFAVALTHRDASSLITPSPDAEIAVKLFPDQVTFRREEQRRFEILDAHWDVPLNEVEMETRKPAAR